MRTKLRSSPAIWTIVVVLILGACASMPGREPLQVTVADVDSIPSEGLELRMMVKLRVQNPNDTPVDYDGVYVKLTVSDKTLATGVSDERGSVPRFGESVIAVPVTASLLRMGVYALGMLGGGIPEKIHYNLDGKLSGPAFGSTNFQSQGDLMLPGEASAPATRK
jgi:LEA14-like dessication related protein